MPAKAADRQPMAEESVGNAVEKARRKAPAKASDRQPMAEEKALEMPWKRHEGKRQPNPRIREPMVEENAAKAAERQPNKEERGLEKIGG